MYDIVIVGAGPAGLSAAITACARNKKVLVISNKPESSPLAKAALVDNYPGMPQASGLFILEQMVEQARGLGAEIQFERVLSIVPMSERFMLTTGDKVIEARSVILAVGVQAAKPFIGETEFLGRGVSYCATCDGMLYRAATVCVVGLNEESVEEANFLAELGATVIFIANKQSVGLADTITVKRGQVVEIKGGFMGVTSLVCKEKENEDLTEIACSGVFILRHSIAPSALLVGLEFKDGKIATDNSMRTNTKGVFAAGDCIGEPLQIAKAVGEGQRACFSAVEFLEKLAKN